MESRKMVLKNLFTEQQQKNRHREQTYGHGEKGEEDEMYGKKAGNQLPYVKQIAIPAVWLRKLKQGLCVNLEGQDGEEDGREVQTGGDICILMADSR